MAAKTTLPRDSEARKAIPLYRGVLRYFPAAMRAAAEVSKVGNDKHNPGEEMHHARGKSMDHADCILRHLVDLDEDFGCGVGYDEQGMPQVGYIVWRAMALAQEWMEKQGVPLAPAAKLPSFFDGGTEITEQDARYAHEFVRAPKVTTNG